jgi:hypothetical protein
MRKPNDLALRFQRLLRLLRLRPAAERTAAPASEEEDSCIIDRTAECAGMGFQIIGAKIPPRS